MGNESKELYKLIKFIAENFRFDEESYPELKGASEGQRLNFAIRHSALHFAKTAGKISAVSEDVDHGGKLDIEELKKTIPKALINTLRLAELVGMSETDLIKAIEEKHRAKYSDE